MLSSWAKVLKIGDAYMVKVKKIFVQGENGQTYTVTQEWMKQYLGICDVGKKIVALENRVHTLEKPMRMQKILDVLKAEGKPRSSYWIERHIPDFRWPDLWDLEKDGKIYYVKSGSHKMWRVAS